MKTFRTSGFTLIELLTVIAIIAILTAMTSVVAPRILERARITSLLNVCNQIKTSCIAYSTKDATKTRVTFPPGYGYRNAPPRDSSQVWSTDVQKFFLDPPMKRLEFFRNFDMYDSFARNSYDTDHDGWISPLEYAPIGVKSGADLYVFPQELYRAFHKTDSVSAALQQEVSSQMTAQRPLVYLPVNHDQFVKVQSYWYKVASTPGRELEGAYARRWLPDETFPNFTNPLREVAAKIDPSNPPPLYDDFVLISAGPNGSTGGILDVPEHFLNDINAAGILPVNWYYVLALRACFLATRDMSVNEESTQQPNIEGNGLFDFDYRNRTRGIEGKPSSYMIGDMCLLPNGTNAPGPLIYASSGGGIK